MSAVEVQSSRSLGAVSDATQETPVGGVSGGIALRDKLLRERLVTKKTHGSSEKFQQQDEKAADPSQIEMSKDVTHGYVLLQKWEGLVLDSDPENGTFVARLTDTVGSTPAVEAELSAMEVSDTDRDLLRTGAAFYWNIGFRTERNGRRVRESWMRFRRLGPARQTLVDDAVAEAASLKRSLGWG